MERIRYTYDLGRWTGIMHQGEADYYYPRRTFGLDEGCYVAYFNDMARGEDELQSNSDGFGFCMNTWTCLYQVVFSSASCGNNCHTLVWLLPQNRYLLYTHHKQLDVNSSLQKFSMLPLSP